MKKITSLLLASTLLLSSACGSVRKETANVGITPASSQSVTGNAVTAETTVGEVLSMPEFQNFGRLLFPVERTVSEDMTLEQVSSSRIYTWYHNIQPEKTVEIINHLIRQADDDQPIFYSIYSESEMRADSSKQDTGLFFFKGESGAKFSIMNAGGGFAYVGAMHDSFPQALELSKMGYNAFALIYRPDDPYRDLAQAITYIYDHAAELEVDPGDYSLWGGSAGARMAATLGNAENLRTLTARTDIPQTAAVITQYTGYQSVSASDAPTYACVGTSDSIASARTMQNRLDALQKLGIPTEFHAYENLPHGFGLGTGTAAEGWIQDAVRFWEDQMPDESIPTARQTANLQDYLLNRTQNTHGNDYDLNGDGVWNGLDLSLLRQKKTASHPVPDTIQEIPEGYHQPAEKSGTLENLYYDTYESMTYDQKEQVLQKRAVIYLPYGYTEEKQYPIFYLMHGGWGNETVTLGTPESPSNFKNVIDHAIQNGDMQPMILVCPTYNNTSGQDSANFSLAMTLNRNYYKELRNDLIPAVESKYSTYAKDTTPEGLAASRDYRGFGGFSMGSVATWRTFEHALDYFHYFMPMSCGTTLNDDTIFSAAENYNPQDYFVFMMTGTSDFAYSYENRRVEKMRNTKYFTEATDEQNGNFAYRVQEGYSHDGFATERYTYNGLCWFWN